jgi:hypothetical protein
MSYGERGVKAYAVFLAICQWSATCLPVVRGLCARSDGRPMNYRQIAATIRMPANVVQDAIALLTSEEVGWLLDDEPQKTQGNTHICQSSADDLPVVCQLSAGCLPQGEGEGEGKGEEEGEGKGEDFCASAAPSHQAKREKYPAYFEAFWQAFPAERRRGKPDALKAWKRATDLIEPQTLIDAAKRYAVSPKAKAGFARMPATWLRAEAWTEDEAAWQGGHTPTAGERRQQRNDEVIGKFFGGSSDGSEGSFAGLIRDLSGGAE